MMRKIDKRVKAGTKIQLSCVNGWQTVKEITGSRRQWVTLQEYAGSFQAAHIYRFTNDNELCKA